MSSSKPSRSGKASGAPAEPASESPAKPSSKASAKKGPTASPTSRLSDAVITQGLKRLLAEKHQTLGVGDSAEWALFFELRSGTGYANTTSYVDAFAFNLWPSKKHWRVAYEIKASRADFLRELAKPEKRAWALEISNEFWYVCYPGVAKPEEIPQGCGLLVANEDLTKLRKTVQAQQREARMFTLSEIGAMARRNTEQTSALFHYAGRDITEKELQELLDSRRDAHFFQAVRAEAEERVGTLIEGAHGVLQQYARDLQKVGLPAPAWMAEPDLRNYNPWEVRKWAQETFVEGPGLADVSRQLHSLRTVKARLVAATEALEQAEALSQELLKRKGPGESA